MENATTEEMHKLSTMKLTITYFTTKLENFITETNATDENFLMLLSHLTDCIQAFVLAAKVIKTNHTIESVIDKSILSCENIFECLACNVQTGKTYNSVLNHVNTTKHNAHAKHFERQRKQQTAPKNIILRPSDTVNPGPIVVPPFPPPNRDFVMNLNQQVNHIPPFPIQNAPNLPLLQNHHMNNMYQPNAQPAPGPIRPFVVINHRLPISPNQMHGPSVNNNISPVNGMINNFNQFSPPNYFSNYKELFRMPPPVNVVGFQQNVVNPSNDFLRNFSPVPPAGSSEKHQPHPGKPNRSRKKRKAKSKDADNISAKIQVKFLDEIATSFLNGNFEDEVTQFISAAQKFSSDDLYTDIIANLKESCLQMGLNVEVTCFGSRIIGIGSDKSDIDLNISATGYSETTDTFLQILLDILRKDSNWSNGIYIKSRVALVRARYVNMAIECDITFNNELAMSNTRLVKYFYLIQPDCCKMVVFIRMLTEKVKLYPQINTYTINLLVFFYLQSKGYLPKVIDLIETSTIKYWPNNFTSKSLDELNIQTNKTFKELLEGFMDFYAHHVDFESNVLSTFTGTAIPKGLFATPEYRSINDCFNGLLQYMEENARAAECIRTNFKMAMCIQDPFSHDHNVSRCVGKLNLKRFKECCHETYEMLLFQFSENNFG